MNAFHPQTIEALRRDLQIWREQLDGAETDLRFREGQAAKAREAAETARQRVADYERLLATVEDDTAPADAYAEYFPEQLDGTACINCAQDFTEGQARKAVHRGPRGPLLAHSNAANCEIPAADDEFLPDPLVFDAAEYYASAERGAATQDDSGLLVEGNCARCGEALAPDQLAYTDGFHNEEQLFAHLKCIETPEERAL